MKKNMGKSIKQTGNKPEKQTEAQPKQQEIQQKEETIEGYGYCSSQQTKCLTDCIGGVPALSSLN